MKATYRQGRHSPINIWADVTDANGTTSSTQVAMATSTQWARAVVEALNEADDRTPPNISGLEEHTWRQRRAIRGLERFLDYLDQPGQSMHDLPQELVQRLRALVLPPEPALPAAPLTDPKRLLVISAATGAEARRFAIDNRVPFGGGPGGEWMFPADPERLRGVTNAWLYVVGGAHPSAHVQTTIQRMIHTRRLHILDDEGLAAVLAVKHAAIKADNGRLIRDYQKGTHDQATP